MDQDGKAGLVCPGDRLIELLQGPLAVPLAHLCTETFNPFLDDAFTIMGEEFCQNHERLYRGGYRESRKRTQKAGSR